ncbi:hypothetical protein LBMAG52_38430 [Planctomycetia bacterium]|nr:hypothetical protein LBMAG52_38430 [Planctomycetia bacterium]
MFRSWFRGCLLALASLFAVMNVAPVMAQSSPGKLALERLATEDTLVFLAWNGWQTPDPKSTNRVDKLMSEPSLREFIEQLGDEVLKLVQKAAADQPDGQLLVETMPVLLKSLTTKPGAFLWSKLDATLPQPIPEMSVVIDTGSDAAQVQEAIAKLKELGTKQGGKFIEETIDGVKFTRPQDDQVVVRFGFKGSYFVVTLGEATTKATLARLASSAKPAAWLTQVSKELSVPRPALLLHINAAGILKTLEPLITDPQAGIVIEALGLRQLKHISVVSGLDADAGVTKVALVTDGAPQGLFALTPDKPLTIGSLKKIPANASNASVMRFDLAHVMEQVLVFADKVQPGSREQAEAALAQFEPQAGFSLKTDLLGALGDEWSYYTSGSEAGALMVPGIVITASVHDHEKLSKTLNIGSTVLKAVLAQFGPQAPVTLHDFTSRGETGHRLTINNLPIPVAPTWVLTKDQFILGITPQLVTSHLSATKSGKSLADHEAIQAAFKRTPKPTSVSFADPKPGLQGLYTLVNTFSPVLLGQLAQQGIEFNLPPLPPMSDLEQHLAPSVTMTTRTPNGWFMESHYVVSTGNIGAAAPAAIAVGVALLLPAVQQARTAARRSQDKNNLKQIGLAFHSFHDVYRHFPAAASVDAEGKKLLSWRVHVLPFVDQNPLYQQFHLDEPWDSDHNKKLIEKIPQVYVSPNHEDLAKQGKTVYLVPTGKGAAFEGDAGRDIREFTDGTSNTIVAVEAHADAAVIWTKPDDLVLDFKNLLKGLKSARVDGFHALFADGSVRFISDAIDVNTLKALFTRAGKEPIPSDAFGDAPPPPRAVARPGDPKNNLKIIGLAFHSYAVTQNRLPHRATTDKNGKTLLSWRVHLLPFLEANDLYQQFHLDEAWDSEHNKALIDKMPVYFTATGDEELAKQGKTRYVTPANAEACLGVKEGTRFVNIIDGTSNTIMAVEVRADAAVIWTKPDDIVIDFKNPLKSLKDARNGGFLTLMSDGSVRMIADKINAETFKALITRAGGEVIGDF